MTRTGIRSWALACAACVLLLPAGRAGIGSAAFAQTQTGARYFAQTGYSVKGRFLDYWNTHGGLLQQGYPLSDELQEVSPTDGKTYTVQYFERAVFEYHPANQPPYDVLLSLLGAFTYGQWYGGRGAPNQHANPDNATTFPQTGTTLGGPFRVYWESHGGLMQQGYPVSNEFTEVSPLDGKPYTVQYFQRAVFESHPENQPPFNVLLSQLGRLQWNAKYATAPRAPKLLAGQAIRQPIAAGNFLFWISVQPNKSVHGYDLNQNREFVIATSANADIYSLASDGKTLAWTEGQQSIRGYDLGTGQEFPIVDVSQPRAIGDAGAPLALAGGVLYYADVTFDETGGPNEGSIYAYNLATKTGQKLVEHGRNPVVKDGILLWSHVEGPNDSGPNEMTLHSRKLDGSMGDTVLPTGPHSFIGYDVSGDNVVWAGFGPDAQVYLYNLKTGQRKELSGSGGLYPLINGDRVVWTEEPNGGLTGGTPSDWSIQVYDIARGAQSLVTKEHADWVLASALAGQGAIVYVKGAVYRQIYLISLP